LWRCARRPVLIIVAATAALMGFCAAPSALAGTYTWDNQGGDTLWYNGSNWLPNHNQVPQAGDTAAFSGAGAGTVTLVSTASTLLDAVLFSNTNPAAAYNLSQGTLQLTLGAITQNLASLNVTNTISSAVQSTAGSFVVTIDGGTLNLAGNLTGTVTGGLQKLGAGTLLLSGTGNSFVGPTFINAGTLKLGVANAIPAGSVLTVAGGGTLDRNNLSLTSNSVTLSGGTISGGGTLVLGGGVSGYGMISGGAINLGGGSRIITANGLLTVADQITGTGPLSKAGAGTLVLANAGTANNWTGGTLAVTAGTLKNGAASQVPDGLTVNVNAGALWDLNGYYEKITALTDVANGTAATVNLNGGTLEMTNPGGGRHYNIAGTTGAVVINGGVLTTDNTGHWDMTGLLYVVSGHINVGHGDATSTIHASDVYISGGYLALMNSDNRLLPTVRLHMSGGVFYMRQQEGWGDAGGNQTVGLLEGTGGVINNNYATYYTLTVNQTSGTATYAGTLVGNLNVTKSGGGTWILASGSGANTYSGTMQISGGTLQLGAANQIPNASPFMVNAGGTFNLGGYNETIAVPTLAGGTIAGAGTLTVTTSTNFQSGLLLAALGGTGPMVKTGSGTGLLGAANILSATAPLTVTNGTLDLQSYNQTASVLTLAGGTLAGTGGAILTVSTNIDLQTGALNVPLIGAANLTKSAGGTVVLSGSNGYGGTTTVSGGTLQLGSTGALPSTTSLTVSGGTLDLHGYTSRVSSLTLTGGTISGAGMLDFGASAGVQAGTITAVLTGGSLTKSSTGTVVLSAANLYSGGTTVSAGILQLAGGPSTAVLGPGSVVLSGGTLAGVGTISGNVSAGSGTHTISPTGVLTTGSLYLSGNTTLDFTNLMSGGVLACTGSLNVLATGSDVVHVALPATLLPDTYKLVDASAVGNAGDANFGLLGGARPGFSLTTSGGDLFLTIVGNYWKGAGGTQWSDSAHWNLGVPNAAMAAATFNGAGGSPVVIDAGATVGALQFTTTASYDIQGPQTLTFDNSGAGTDATILMSATSGSQTLSAAVVLASNVTVMAGPSGVTLSGPISGTGKGLTLTGGLLVLSSTANSYSGDTNVGGGTLRMGALNAASSASTVVLSAGGTLDLNTFDQAVPGLSGAGGTVTNLGSGTPILTVNQTGTATFSGRVTGSVGLAKAGAGTFILGAANVYTGGTTISAGTLRLGAANGVSPASALVMSNGVFDLNGFSQTVAGLSGSGGTIGSTGAATLTINQTNSSGYSGVISGAITLTKSGSGTLLLGAANTYTGGTNINGGTLKLGLAAAIPTAGGINIATGGTLDRNGFNMTPAGLNLSGGTLAGAGSLTLSAGLTGTGAITGGTLDLGGGATRRVINVAGGTLTIGDAITNGNFQKEGNGTLVLTNSANAFTLTGLSPYGIMNAGIVRSGASEVLGNVTYNIENTAQWDLNGFYETLGGFASGSDASTILLSGGTLRANGYGGSYNGSIVGPTGTFIMAADPAGGFYGIESLNNPAGYTLGTLILERGNLKTNSLTGTTVTAGSIELQGGTVGGGGLRLSSSSAITKTTTGTVRLGAANVLATSPLAISDGVLDLGTYNQTVTTLTLTGGTLAGSTGVLTLATSADVRAGTISAKLSGGVISKSTEGTVRLGADDLLSAAPLIVNAGTFDLQGYVQTVPTLTMAGGTLAGAGGGTLMLFTSADVRAGTISANLGGPAGLTKTTAGMLILSGDNTFSGPVAFNGGTVSVAAGNNLGDGSGTNLLNFGGGALQATNTFSTNRSVAVAAAGGTVNVDNTKTLELSGPLSIAASGTLTKSGLGALSISGSQSNANGSSIVVNQGQLNLNTDAGAIGHLSPTTPSVSHTNLTANNSAAVSFGGSQALESFTLNNTSSASLAAGANTIYTKTLSMSTTGTKLNLSDGNLVVDYTGSTPLATITALVKAGVGTSDGNGKPQWNAAAGITSSNAQATHLLTALGIRDSGFTDHYGSQPALTSVDDVPVDSSAVVVKYTWAGDANLDGKVDVNDYNVWNYFLLNPPTGENLTWFTGDFNYDGKIDVNDYNIWTYGFLNQGGTLSDSSIGSVSLAPTRLPDGQVPEPTTLVLLAAGGLVALARKRRRE
jgi:autotransporter-associated beta strand protein